MITRESRDLHYHSRRTSFDQDGIQCPPAPVSRGRAPCVARIEKSLAALPVGNAGGSAWSSVRPSGPTHLGARDLVRQVSDPQALGSQDLGPQGSKATKIELDRPESGELRARSRPCPTYSVPEIGNRSPLSFALFPVPGGRLNRLISDGFNEASDDAGNDHKCGLPSLKLAIIPLRRERESGGPVFDGIGIDGSPEILVFRNIIASATTFSYTFL